MAAAPRKTGEVKQFEIQVFQRGTWRSVGGQDTRESALKIAKELAKDHRVMSVKVLSNQYDSNSGHYLQNTVYRSGQVENKADQTRASEEAYNQMSERRRTRQQMAEAKAQRERAARQQARESLTFALNVTFRLLLLTAVGVGLLYWLLKQY